MLLRVVVFVIIVLSGMGYGWSQGIPESITYQGKLTDTSGVPVSDGQRSMRFKLFSAETAGSQLWDSGAMNIVTSGGIFSVALGASPTPPITSATLTSDSVWIEVTVGADLPLPRTKFSSVPFALRAGVAESVTDNSISSAKIVDGEVKTADLGPDSVTTDKILNETIQLADIGQNGASANQVIKRNSSNTAWVVANDSDTQDTDWVESGSDIYRSTGNIGIGLTAPNRKLYIVENTSGLSYPLKIDNPHSAAGDATGILSAGGSGGNVLETSRGKGALVYEYKSTWNRGDFHFLQESGANNSNPSLLNAALTIKNNGNVGIGSTNPVNKLQVNGGNGAMIGIDGGAESSGLVVSQAGQNRWSLFVRKWQSDNFVIHDDVASVDTMTFSSGTGKVGIGTANLDAKLHVVGGSGKAVYGKASNGLGVIGYGVYGEANYNAGIGVYGANVTNSNYGYLGSDQCGVSGQHSGGNSGSLGGSDYAVKAEGDMVVTGAYKGNLGLNEGAPFPRPAYNSGWQVINSPSEFILSHNLGGNVDNYVVDLQFKDHAGSIHNRGFGLYLLSDYDSSYAGACMTSLTSSYCKIYRPLGDYWVLQFRVRIWIIN